MYSLEHPVDGIKAPEHERLPVNFRSFKVTFFLFPQCDHIHVQSHLDYQAIHRLDVGPWRISRRHQHPNEYEHSTWHFRDLCFSSTLCFVWSTHHWLDTKTPFQPPTGRHTCSIHAGSWSFSTGKQFLVFIAGICSKWIKDVPDLPATLEDFDQLHAMLALHFILIASMTDFSARASTGSASMVKGFKKFLQSLGDNMKYDHLRLPLQVSALLTPILLLYPIQIHKSENYCQRYRVLLVCAVFLGF